jgi:hypothetical protein
MVRFVVEVWARRWREGWLVLVWLEAELRQVLFVEGGSRDDAWWVAQEWVALHGGG